jgi:two-component system LytT family response regulator
MVNAIHIEDESANVKLLEALLKKHCGDIVNLCGNAAGIDDGLILLEKIKPSLVFLDIELQNGNAFDFLAAAGSYNFEVIFITAYSNFAVKAFRYQVVDYLLKPIDIEDLKQATERAVKKIKAKNSTNSDTEILQLLKQNLGIKKIGVPSNDSMIFIDIDEIVHCEARGSYSMITLINNKTSLVTKSLKDLEGLLPANMFIRVHNSWIINIKYLRKYFRGKNSYIEMENGSIVSVSIRRKGDILDQFLNG